MHKKVSYGGLATALSVILLLMSGYLPSGKAATMFMASVTVFVMCTLTNKKTAFVIYAATTLLSMLIIPSALAVLLSYGICFGNYPVIKTYLEQKTTVLGQILSKMVIYTIYFFLVYAAFVFVAGFSIPYAVFIMYFCGIIVFAFYDWLLTYTGIYILSRFFKSF